MAAVLQQVLERTELNKLPKLVQNKLEKFLADQQSEIDGLKGRHEKFKVESGKQEALRLRSLIIPPIECTLRRLLGSITFRTVSALGLLFPGSQTV